MFIVSKPQYLPVQLVEDELVMISEGFPAVGFNVLLCFKFGATLSRRLVEDNRLSFQILLLPIVWLLLLGCIWGGLGSHKPLAEIMLSAVYRGGEGFPLTISSLFLLC